VCGNLRSLEKLLPNCRFPEFNSARIAGSTSLELARDWALSAEDGEETLRCRGGTNRLSFALQLCVVRHYGRFLDDYAGVSARILNFLSRQLDLPPVLAVEPSSREGTHQEHQRRIREYLGLQTFDPATQERIERWVCGGAAEGLSPAEIFPHTEETLDNGLTHTASLAARLPTKRRSLSPQSGPYGRFTRRYQDVPTASGASFIS
jgi:hypothetical protein